MQYQRLKHFTKRIDECDTASANIMSSTGYSSDMMRCLQGAVIERKHNLIELMRQEGVSIDEVV
mgnify:CR=1 FL=1